MAADYTNDTLLENIRLRAMLPESQNLYTDARLLMLADDELQTVIFPMIMSIKGDYFVAVDTQTMTSSLTYPIPGDAVGIKIKDAYWRDPNWPDTQPDSQITQINYQDLTGQGGGSFQNVAFYVMGNDVHLTNVYQGKYLKLRYYKRASKLVPNDEGGIVTAVNTGTEQITLDAVPSDWEVGDTVDAIAADPPFETTASALTISNIAGSVITVDDADDVSVGDWICLEGETTIAQITPEAHPILAQSVAVKCLEGLSDPNMVTSQAKFEQLKKAFIDTMTPRVDGQAKKIVNRSSPLVWNKVQRGWGNGF